MTATEFTATYPNAGFTPKPTTTNISINQTDTANNLMLISFDTPNRPRQTAFIVFNDTQVCNYYIFSICGFPIIIKKPNT